MKPKPFLEFIKRFFKQTGILITGLAGFFVVLIIQLWIPDLSSFNTYISIFVISFIFASYLTFKDLYLDYYSLLQEKNKLEQSRPIFNFGFINSNNNIVEELNILLGENPPKPNFDELIDKKRHELLQNSTLSTRNLFNLTNKNYLNEIDPYLEKYRNYLENLYECNIDKAFQVFFSIHNSGSIPANDIYIEIKMPAQYMLPKEHQCFDRKTTAIDDIRYYINEPREPKLTYDSLFDASNYNLPYFDNNNDLHLDQARIQGPDFDLKEGQNYINYRIQKLVQHTNDNKLDPIWIWLGNITHDEMWEFEIKITCSEIPIPVKKKLVIDINYDNENQENKFI